MSVSEDRICRFELMEPLDSTALKKGIDTATPPPPWMETPLLPEESGIDLKNHTKGQIERDNTPNSFVSWQPLAYYFYAMMLGISY